MIPEMFDFKKDSLKRQFSLKGQMKIGGIPRASNRMMPKIYGKVSGNCLKMQDLLQDQYTYSLTTGAVTGTNASKVFYFINIPDYYIITSVKVHGTDSTNPVYLRRQPKTSYDDAEPAMASTTVNVETSDISNGVVDNDLWRYFVVVEKGANDTIYSVEVNYKIRVNPKKAYEELFIGKKIVNVFGTIQTAGWNPTGDNEMHATRGALFNVGAVTQKYVIPVYLPQGSKILSYKVYGTAGNWTSFNRKEDGVETNQVGDYRTGAASSFIDTDFDDVDNDKYWYWIEIFSLTNGEYVSGAEIVIIDPNVKS